MANVKTKSLGEATIYTEELQDIKEMYNIYNFEIPHRDFYLDNTNVLKRLHTEYEKYGKIIIAYDFDDTVYDFHKQGRVYSNVIELLKKCKEYAYFIVYTASDEDRYPEIIEYLKNNEIPFDTINENISHLNIPKGKKLYYNILLDDRAGLASSYKVLNNLIEIIKIKNIIETKSKEYYYD